MQPRTGVVDRLGEVPTELQVLSLLVERKSPIVEDFYKGQLLRSLDHMACGEQATSSTERELPLNKSRQ